MKLLALVAVFALGLALKQSALPQAAEAASLLSMLPGADMLRDLTYATLDSLSSSIDQVLGRSADFKEQFLNDFAPILNGSLNLSRDPDAGRNVSQIIRSRGFEAEEYDVVTRDGYILTIQRIINPLVKPEARRSLKPVILQHGLMSSSVDWVINSFDVRPSVWPKLAPDDEESGEENKVGTSNLADEPSTQDSQAHPNALGFYLANEGYDVFLGNSRGNIYGQRHTSMSAWDPKFWAFSFDEQIQYDLPDTIAFVQGLTGHTKLAYVGHSQGTAIMFGLMAERPEYADIVEPFVALAPVAYVNHAISPAKYFSVYTPIFQHVDMWFATNNIAVRYLGPIVCGPEVVRKEICANIIFLSVGFDEEELDQSRVSAYLDHMPSGTSVKNIAHYGQEVLSGRFAKFDHGLLTNQVKYNQREPPDYKLSNIRSKSIVLFVADNDWLASPPDVARLRADLGTKPYAVYNITEEFPKWNHIDFLYGKHAGELVNTKILRVLEHFRQD